MAHWTHSERYGPPIPGPNTSCITFPFTTLRRSGSIRNTLSKYRWNLNMTWWWYIKVCVGALAGTAAVLFSMPADCIKVHMELQSARPPPGFHNSIFAFFKTGRVILAETGFQGLFRGVRPRLLETVPSTMFYWVLVATLRRTLEPLIIKEHDSALCS